MSLARTSLDRTLRFAHGAAAALLVLSSAVAASAQTPPPPTAEDQIAEVETGEPTTAREWFAFGEAQYRIGQYQSAADAWVRAYSLDPRPRIQYNLAQAYERLGRLEDAIHSYETFTSAPDQDQLVFADAMARLIALRERLARTGVTIHGGPSAGEIFVDGQAWGVMPRPDRIPLTPGTHRVEVRYTEGRAFRTSVNVPAGQVTDVEITDETITGTVTQVVEVEAAPGRSMLFVGAGIAGVGVGTLIYGIERQVKVSACTDPGSFCENLSTGERERSIGLAIGGTLTAAGAAMIVVDLLRHSSYERRQNAVTCAPFIAGAQCRVRF